MVRPVFVAKADTVPEDHYLYLAAYELCEVPKQRLWLGHEHLDLDIITQLRQKGFALPYYPDAFNEELTSIAMRIRKTWIRKYDFTFLTNEQRKRFVKAFPHIIGIAHARLRQVPPVIIPDAALPISPQREATEPIAAPSTEGPAAFASENETALVPVGNQDHVNSNNANQSDCAEGAKIKKIKKARRNKREPDFPQIFKTLDDIKLPENRKRVRQIQGFKQESIARCMEALLKSEMNVGQALEWLDSNKIEDEPPRQPPTPPPIVDKDEPMNESEVTNVAGSEDAGPALALNQQAVNEVSMQYR